MRLRPALLLLLAATGCEFGSTITVEGDGTQPRFVVTYDHGKPACVDELTVGEAREGGVGRQVSAVGRDYQSGKDTCRDKIDYGRVPPRYQAAAGFVPLRPGVGYVVSANGAGWHTSTAFTPGRH